MKNNNVSKKKGFIQTFAEESELIQGIIAIMIIAAVIGGDYGITLIECYYGKLEPVIGVKIPLMFTNLIVMGFLFLFTLFTVPLVTEKLIPQFILAIKRLPAIYRYCFIPLTEEEVKDHGFTSARDYFLYVKEQLYYGEYDGKAQYVLLSPEDLQKMLTVCICIFGKKSIFELQDDDLIILNDFFDINIAFVLFLQKYRKYQKDNKVLVSVSIKKSGAVILSFKAEHHKEESVRI